MHIANFFQDFPSRCNELLESFDVLSSGVVGYELSQCVNSKHAKEALKCLKQREVTMLIMVTAAALTIPYEILVPDDAQTNIHPGRPRQQRDMVHAMRNANSHDDIKQQMLLFLSHPFRCMNMYARDVRHWAYCQLPANTVKPTNYCSLNYVDLPAETTAFDVIECFRNALAHGNLQTGSDAGRIEYIVFVTGRNTKSQPYRCLRVSPIFLRNFLSEWFEFLQGMSKGGTQVQSG